MRLIAFQVQRYKTVLNSGRVEIRPDVTCLLGQNESGKSSILQAIWKSRNVAKQTFDRLYDYTKHLYTRERKTNPVVTTLEFILEDAEKREFADAFDAVAPELVVLKTTYDGTSTLDAAVTPSDPDTATAAASLETFCAFVPEVTEGQEDPTKAARDLAGTVLKQLRAKNVVEARKSASRLCKALEPLRAGHSSAASLITELEAVQGVKTASETRSAILEWLSERLPAFIYFDEYGVLRTRINLPAYVKATEQDGPTAAIRAQAALFKWAELDPSELLKLGESRKGDEKQTQVDRRKEERRTLLQSASFSLSGDWKKWWPQDREHKLHLDADGDDVVLQVSDTKNPWNVDFQERSRGFQWFFSFYLTFLVESELAHQGAILLLDEPGLHLHITAQKYLMGFFREVSKKNQVIYTSHSPFMVDPANLDNVRTVYLQPDEDTGYLLSRVSPGTEPEGDRSTLLPLQAALAYQVADTLFLGKKVLIVEGITDYWLLKTLSTLLNKATRIGLPEDVVVLFAGGTSHMLPLVSLFAQPDEPERRLVVLLDADKAGLEKAKQLRRELLPRSESVAVISDDDLLGKPDLEVEDIVSRAELIEAVQRHFASPIVNDPTVASNMPFLKKVYKEQAGELTRDAKAALVLFMVDLWRAGTGPDAETLDKAELVMKGLTARFVRASV